MNRIKLLLKQKYWIQISIYVFVFILLYIIALKPTVDLITSLQAFKKVKNSASNTISVLEISQKKYDQLKFYFNHNDSTNINHEKIHEMAGIICNKFNVNFSAFEGPVKVIKNNIQVNNHIITFEGNYNNLLKALHQLEYFNLGMIASTSFIKTKDIRTRNYKLYLKIYLQTFSSNENI